MACEPKSILYHIIYMKLSYLLDISSKPLQSKIIAFFDKINYAADVINSLDMINFSR